MARADVTALELLADLSKVLARWGRWYLFGAQAVIVHGVPRLSADVDVTLRPDPDDPERFAREMADAPGSREVARVARLPDCQRQSGG